MRRDFEGCNGLDILDLFALTVMDSREHLDGVDSHKVRQHFLDWAAQAPSTEQQSEDLEDLVASATAQPKAGLSPRYRFAIQVDADALRLVVHDAPPLEEQSYSEVGWVRFIDAAWQQGAKQSLQANLREGRLLSMPLRASDDHKTFPAVEGMTDKHVGWMKIPYDKAQCGVYVDSRDPNRWSRVYCRPPMVLGWPWDNM